MHDASLIFVLDAQLPFVRHPEEPGRMEESGYFTALSETYLPLLRSCTALETGGIPFKLAIAFSPLLCEMLADPLLQQRYVDFLDRTIAFGETELDRKDSDPERRAVVERQLKRQKTNRHEFVEIYEKNILKKFDYFATHGYMEILATTATPCFLPLYVDIPEAINAQIETGLIIYRKHFTSVPAGFWLPAMACKDGLEKVLKSYGFMYTLVDSHALLFADPPPKTGIFSPAVCENGFSVFARDTLACAALAESGGIADRDVYLDVEHDIGFEYDEELLSALFSVELGRRKTGYCYHSRRKTGDGEPAVYRVDEAEACLDDDVSSFVHDRLAVMKKASKALDDAPVTDVLALPASFFGQEWHEGVLWFEKLARNVAENGDLSLSLPFSRLSAQDNERITTPYYSSWLPGGYAEEVLNSSNDWMYPFVRKATLRMIDLAERFPDDDSLKERALNMAARELLLSQSMDWFLMMNRQDQGSYARERFEDSIRSFTVVYESLGSNFISTEWLTRTEKRDNFFPEINYRVYSKRK